MTAVRKVPAAEVRRLARIRELAAQHRRTGRALVRAMIAARQRGISVRKIAAAAQMPPMTVQDRTRPRDGQPPAATTDKAATNGLNKRNGAGT